jgi:hypothetical protein
MKLAPVVATVLMLSGCGFFESTQEKQIKVCVADIQLGLEDPNSIEIISVEPIKLDNGWHRLLLKFTAKNIVGGRARDETICGFKSVNDVDLNPDDFMNKNRELTRGLREIGINLK